MYLLSAHKDTDSVLDILFSLYRIFLPLMLSDILSYYLPILLLLAIHTQLGSNQLSLLVCTLSYRTSTLMHSMIQSYSTKTHYF